WAFYGFAVLGLVWWAAWQPNATSSPVEHPRVSEAELAELAEESAQTVPGGAPSTRVLLGSTAVWAIVIGHFCNNWSGYVLLSWAPFYLLARFGVDFHAIGLYVMAPSIVSFLSLNGAGAIGDKLIARG